MTSTQLRMIEAQKNKPKLTGKICRLCCVTPLTDVNVFFGKDTCGNCAPIHLLHQERNNWVDPAIKDTRPNDLPF